MPLCLSLFERTEEHALSNHAHYARMYGYPHRVVQPEGLHNPLAREVVKYSQALRHLRELAEGDWMLLLSEATLIFRPVAIETLLQGRDALICEGPEAKGWPHWVMSGMLLLRNSEANRTMLHRMIDDATRVLALQVDHFDESARLHEVEVLPCNAIVGGSYVHIHWRTPGWQAGQIFVISLSPLPAADRNGTLLPRGWQHDLQLQSFLASQINGAFLHGRAVLQAPGYPALSEDLQSSYNGGASIALITLYTSHIAAYARVSEHNVKRYCDRHGYGFHVYRALPAELDNRMAGNWAKPWLLKRHLAKHEWVIWIDADTLFVNPARSLEALLVGRDRLYAKDMADWRVNSGVLGFRNTAVNGALLERLWRRIEEVPDKSTVYSSMGDQYHINVELEQSGLAGEGDVLDLLSVNTPSALRDANSLLVHYLDLGEPYRSAFMANQDLESLKVG